LSSVASLGSHDFPPIVDEGAPIGALTSRTIAGAALLLSAYYSRVIEKRTSRSGEFDAARAARQELRAGFIFEIADLAAKRRLRRVQPAFGRDGEAALLGHRHEIPKASRRRF
jgi:hypothetical protein